MRAGEARVFAPGLAFGLLVLACAQAGPIATEQADARIAAGLEAWFSALARSAPGADPLAKRADAPRQGDGLEFSLANDSAIPAADLEGWIAAMRTGHPHVAYRIAQLEVTDVAEVATEVTAHVSAEGAPSGRASHRVRFALERRAIDESGLVHIALSDQTWRVETPPGRLARVTAIAMEPRLAFPGTGPQIVCY